MKPTCFQVIQLGTSACGATALVNVLQALEVDFPLPPLLEAVDTRLRRPDSPLPDYLLSRSRAGCNHRDLEAGAARVSPRIVTRFFPFHRRSIAVAAWLARWITAGCVPILTLNVQRAVQRPGELPADAWHHQMVWGVADREVYLANPLEMVQERELMPQLDSPSELIVRRSDVVSRCGPETDLLELRDFGEQWRSLNVLGQVTRSPQNTCNRISHALCLQGGECVERGEERSSGGGRENLDLACEDTCRLHGWRPALLSGGKHRGGASSQRGAGFAAEKVIIIKRVVRVGEKSRKISKLRAIFVKQVRLR